MRIFHIATESDWTAAVETGAYTTSTLGRTLEDEGFIHASRADQWERIRTLVYAEVDEPLVLLEIETDLVEVPVVEEVPGPDTTETFPHVYGPIPTIAVVDVRRLV